LKVEEDIWFWTVDALCTRLVMHHSSLSKWKIKEGYIWR